MNLSEIVYRYMLQGFARPIAQNLAAEDVILTKIARSDMAEHVTLKGGIVMYNLTKNLRRATRDIDFDFIRYSIDEASVRLFFEKLNQHNDGFRVQIEAPIQKLHQQDYEGVRVNARISDDSRTSLKLKLDIGVHKHLKIRQNKLLFKMESGETMSLRVNSPEQVFAEKCISLGRLGPASTRYKDVYDLYYLISAGLDDGEVQSILQTFINDSSRPPRDLARLKSTISKALSDENFASEAQNAKNQWLDVPFEEAAKTINEFLSSL